MTAPNIFDQNADGFVILLDAELPAEEHRAVREVATVCLGTSIFVKEIPA